MIEHILNSDKSIKQIVESSLSRIWQFIDKRVPFAMVSLSRFGMTDQEKRTAFSELKQRVRQMGYGYLETKGGYKEDGSEEFSEEESLIIPKITKEEAIKLGQIDRGYGPQDTILYSDGKDFLRYIVTNHTVGAVGSIDKKFDISDPHKYFTLANDAVKEYYSRLVKGSHKGKKFIFIPESFTLYEMGQRRQKKYTDKDWWYNFGRRVL